MIIPFKSLFVTFSSYPRPLPLLSPPLPPPPTPSTWTLSGLCLPATITTYPPVPLVSSLLPHTGPEAIAYKCTARQCSAFSECTPTLPRTMPPPFPLLPRCIPTSCLPNAVVAYPSIFASPGPGTLPRTRPMWGVTTHASAPKISTD